MRTSLTELKQTEAWLQKSLEPQESLLFEARLLSSPLLRLHVQLQTKAYHLLKLFHRHKLKEEVRLVEDRLFTNPEKQDFQQQIFQLFDSKHL